MTEPAVSLLKALTPEERAEGIAEATTRALKEFPQLGHEGVGLVAAWSQQSKRATAGVLVQVKRFRGGVIAEKTYDDLRVLAVASVRLGHDAP